MPISTFVEPAALLVVAAASLRAAAGVYSFAGRRYRAAREEKKFTTLFRQFANDRFAEAQSRPQNPGEGHRWNGKRKFLIAQRVHESPDKNTCSFYLVPYDGEAIPVFKPGQFLTFDIPVLGQGQTETRTYSLSNSPAERRYYRVTIKRLGAPANAPPGTPPGTVSNYFHRHLQTGAVVDVRAPSGAFSLDQESPLPIILVAGGVGITPFVSMLEWLAATKSNREVWLFYGVRNRAEHAMYDRLVSICRQRPNIRMVVAYSRPTKSCVKGRDYHVIGRLNADIMKPVVQGRRSQIYLCGPGAMMASLTHDLTALGVSPSDINVEAFGVAKSSAAPGSESPADAGGAETFHVHFTRSGTSAKWTAASGSLLDLAEANGIKARCGCRQGLCGTCTAGLANGQVDYYREPANEPPSGACLPCIAKPKSDLVLDM